MKDHRQHLRINESIGIAYKVVSPPDGRGGSNSMDISEGGISFPIDQRLLPGIIIRLEVALSGAVRPIEVTGEVMWVRERDSSSDNSEDDQEYPYLIGLKFIKIDLRDRDRIYYYIHKKMGNKKSGDLKWLK